jgi:hypothetical protein
MVDLTIRRYGPDQTALTEASGLQRLIQTALIGVSPAWDEVYRVVREEFGRSRQRQQP